MRWFEDFRVGDTFDLGDIRITRDEIIRFARLYDPQSYHIDDLAAAGSPFGGLIASGWHTVCLFTRLYVDQLLGDTATVGSPGVEQLRWLAPVRPGDLLHGRARILTATPSTRHVWRGTLRVQCELLTADATVMSMVAWALVRRRDASAISG